MYTINEFFKKIIIIRVVRSSNGEIHYYKRKNVYSSKVGRSYSINKGSASEKDYNKYKTLRRMHDGSSERIRGEPRRGGRRK